MKILPFIKRHIFLVSFIAFIAIVIGIIAGRAGSGNSADLSAKGLKKVALTNVAIFRKGYINLPANGQVESKAQADLRSQVSAPVSSISVSIGDMVYPGQTIMELQNSDTRAQLAQAEATLALAKGQYSSGSISLDAAKSGAIDKVNDSYIKSYDIVFSQIDPLLNNYNGNGSRLTSLIVDSKLSNEILDYRIDLTSLFRAWKAAELALSVKSDTKSILDVVAMSETTLTKVQRLLDDVSKALNDASSSATPEFTVTLNQWKSVVGPARSIVSGAIQAVNGAEAALSNAASSQGSTAPAQVALAEAGVNNLQAQLAKTIIRSPITGRIAALPLREGELATPGTLLSTVVGEDSGLVIKAYASSEDSPRIKVGASVAIKDGIKGIVASVSPSLSSANKKVEVVISVLDPEKSGLIVGDNVQVSIATDGPMQTNAPATYILPIQDIKIIPGSAYVFTVDSDSKIKKNEVILGDVSGDFIEVKSGLNDSMDIVTPVYELDEGQKVVTEQ